MDIAVDRPTGTVSSGPLASDPRWAAVLARDPAADGTFVFSVASTGVYCRPSCASRRARAQNVAFHADGEAAERAGFRACRRCRPDEAPAAERQAALVARLCRRIEAADGVPNVAGLAGEAGLSVSHLHRLFRAVTGLTPAAYARAARAERVRAALSESRSVTEAFYGAGFGSSGRFYEAADAALGMAPGGYRAGGAGETIRFATAPCSLGRVLVARSSRGVCAILLGDADDALAAELRGRFPRAELVTADDDAATLPATLAAVVALVEAPRGGHALPLDLRGTVFQRRVWQALTAIPAGRTATYSEIAAAVGAPGAVRAVAGACAANPVAVAVPCHRVLRRDGALSGYRWGVTRKRALLDREGGGEDKNKASK